MSGKGIITTKAFRNRRLAVDNTQNIEQKESKKGFSGLQVFAMVTGAVILAVVITLVAAWAYLFPRPFKPVILTSSEQAQLEAKLDKVESFASATPAPPISSPKDQPEKGHDKESRLTPQAYSEEGASREVVFSEREVNALVATNTDLADKLAVDLSDNLVSARLLVPVDPDVPFFGGKTLRVRAGVEVAYREGRPVVKLRGVSLMGVPLPNAWMGGIKNMDLVHEFSGDEGFWKAFGEGVASITVGEGKIHIVLKE